MLGCVGDGNVDAPGDLGERHCLARNEFREDAPACDVADRDEQASERGVGWGFRGVWHSERKVEQGEYRGASLEMETGVPEKEVVLLEKEYGLLEKEEFIKEMEVGIMEME
jgi:hypothetical protein